MIISRIIEFRVPVELSNETTAYRVCPAQIPLIGARVEVLHLLGEIRNAVDTTFAIQLASEDIFYGSTIGYREARTSAPYDFRVDGQWLDDFLAPKPMNDVLMTDFDALMDARFGPKEETDG